MARKLYSFADHPEHKDRLPEIRDKWIANAMSTSAMSEEDRAICRDAVSGLYRAAGLEPPPPERIVFAPSPLVAHFAAGFAAHIWSRPATQDETRAATRSATMDATMDATWAATEDAIRVATRAATWASTQDATPPSFYLFGDMRRLADSIGDGRRLLESARYAWRYRQGGNQWSGVDSYLSFFKDVAGLDIDFGKWRPWETLSLHSGPRCVHSKFCIISDRPETLLVDESNRPHCDTGPFCRWRDGAALYAVHGVYVPWDVIERPESVTLDRIHKERNTEVQRVMIERYGWDRYSAECGAEVIDHDERWGTLCRRNTDGGAVVFLRVINGSPEPDGSFRQYILPVAENCEPLPDPDDPDGELGAPQEMTALNAVASTYGLTGWEYAALAVRT